MTNIKRTALNITTYCNLKCKHCLAFIPYYKDPKNMSYEEAKKVKGKPTAVIANTVKGKGVSYMENQASWHHGVMTEEQYEEAVKELEEVLA